MWGVDDRSSRWLRSLELPAAALAKSLGDDTFFVVGAAGSLSLREKVAAEAAILVLIGTRGTTVRALEDPVVNFVVTSLESLVESQRAQMLLARHPAEVSALAWPHVAVRAHRRRVGRKEPSRPSTAVADVERRLFAPQALTWPEEDFRHAEVRWLRAEWLAESGSPPPARAWSTGLPPGRLALDLTYRRAYELTHQLMFRSAFGAVSLAASVHERAQLGAVLDAHLACCIVSERLDLMAEFLICVVALGLPRTAYWSLAYRLLHLVWDEFGIVPTHGLRPTPGPSATSADPVLRLISSGCHATLVAGLLEALLIRAAPAPAMTDPQPVSHLSVREAATIAEAVNGSPGWWRRCVDSSSAELAVVADGLLSCARRQQHAAAVAALTRLRVARGDSTTPTMAALATR